MHAYRVVMVVLVAAGCSGSGIDTTPDPVAPVSPDAPPDQPPPPPPPPPPKLATASACTTNDQCRGGTCLGAPGGREAGNKNFAGGYCTTVGCTADSQGGCGPDEWCIDGGFDTYCIQMCSRAEGLTCSRADHVCLGLGTFGGCFSNETVECNRLVRPWTCPAGDNCIRIGFEDHSLGRCETTCVPFAPSCPAGAGCYYIRTYNAAFCNNPAGEGQLTESCSCDRCCQPGLVCLDPGPGGRKCHRQCRTADPMSCGTGATCVAVEAGAPIGGCVATAVTP